ncbi:uncharacterized protein [Diabrotica undecimpunctata]|uniref:uncharacterized protein n=1 Tax=Diabrotica undecimpunctata TaxID=50387 RepID=UPI003B639F72
MYRQVSVADDQKSLQCILRRNNPEEPIEIFQLQTVTYGMKCFFYLAIKCLMTLAEEQEAKNPNIASIIKSDFYVDDLLTGFDSKQKAREACKQLFEVLKGGGFTLRQFYSNDTKILRDIPDNSTTGFVIQFGENEKAKTLRLLYSPQSDTLFFSISLSLDHIITKRTLLSYIAQIFYPLGLLSACTIIAKITLQQLWLERLSWDDPIPEHLANNYLLFRNKLESLNNLKIPRHIIYSSIVLSWLKTSANLLKTFVSNRVAEIQETTSFAQWRHVPGKDNPADLVSRGVEPDKIIKCNLWWHGPEWLMQDSDKWPNLQVAPTETSETRKNIKVLPNKLDETQNTEVFVNK